jgi:hypothetical protein
MGFDTATSATNERSWFWGAGCGVSVSSGTLSGTAAGGVAPSPPWGRSAHLHRFVPLVDSG